jgi:hypothetical protein
MESSKIALAKAMQGDLNINYDTCFAEWGERSVNSLATACRHKSIRWDSNGNGPVIPPVES